MNELLCNNVPPTQVASLELSSDLQSLQNYTSILHKCRKDKDLAIANRVHIHLCGNGLEANKTIGNHLVPMFVECGSALYAQQVFNRLASLNEFSWTSLIVGYIEKGDVLHALNLYERMNEDHVSPSKFTYMALIKACAKLKHLEKGRELHAAIVKDEHECDHFIGSSLLGMYAKCGCITEALDTFEELPIQDVVSWTALITAYVDQGFAARALECFEKMLEEGLTPDRVTYINILKACGKLKDLERGKEVHNKIRKQNFGRESSVTTALVDMYGQCGAFVLAKEVLGGLSRRDVVPWNSLIGAYIDQGMNKEALSLFVMMQKEEVLPDATTFVCSIKACAKCLDIDMGLKVHRQADELGFNNHPFVGSALVDMYSRFGLLEKAQKTFDSLSVKEVVSWTALISGYSEHGFDEQALLCFRTMQQEGMELDAITLMCCLRSVGNLAAMHIGQELHVLIIEEGFEQDERLGSSLVTMYAKCGLLAEAHDVFIELEDPDLVSWTVMIAGYAEQGQGEAALDLLQQMQSSGLHPDAVTFVSALKACSSATFLSHGQSLHGDIAKEGLEGIPFVASSLMDLYVKCGCISEALDVFHELPDQDTIPWTVMIKGFVDNGFSEKAMVFYNEMRQKGVSPNSCTLASVLRACGDLGDPNSGRQVHHEVILNGSETDQLVRSSLVGMYAKMEFPEEAKATYFKDQLQDPSVFNSLVLGYLEQGMDKEAFDMVCLEAVYLDATTFVCCLKTCSALNSLMKGHTFHIDIMKLGFDQDYVIGTALVDLYVSCGSIMDAQKVFDNLFIQDVVLWNTLLAGYVESGFNEEAVECLVRMQKTSILANVSTYALIIRLYTNIGCLLRCQELHQEMVMKGVESDQFVASALLGMYGKFGLLAEVQEVFDKLASPDHVCWNILFSVYAEHEYLEELLDQLMGLKVLPNATLYLSGLKACKETASLGIGRKIHALIAQEGFEDNALIGRSLIDMYINCGSVHDANEVFEELPVHDVFAWTALIAGYSEQGFDQKALVCYDQMQQDGLFPDVVTLVCGLQACGNLGAVDKVQAIHLELTKKGYEKDPSVGNHLVQIYAKCSLLPDAQIVFDDLSYQSVISWTALIIAYSNKGFYYHRVVDILEKIESQGNSADAVAIICSLRATATCRDAWQGRQLHIILTKRGFDSHLHVGNTLVGMYAKCNSLEEAHYVFDRLNVQDIVSWTALIGGLGEQGFLEGALECFSLMQLHGVLPDVVSWNTIILGLVEQEQSEMAHLYFQRMQEQGLLPSSMIHIAMSKAYGSSASLDACQKCHARTCNIKLETSEVIMTAALIDMYGKCGDMVVAQEIFNASAAENVVTWNALVAGYTGQGQNELAFSCLWKMLKSTQPDEITFVTAITACSHVGFVELGQQYFKCMTNIHGIEPKIKHYNCLLDLLARAGQVDEALLILSSIPFEVDFVMLSTVIGACQKRGDLSLGRLALSSTTRHEEHNNALLILMSNLQVYALQFDDDDGVAPHQQKDSLCVGIK